MVTNIYGKIGGGKTYYAVKEELLTELVDGYRVIVTNIALDLGNIAAYLAVKYPDREPIDLNDRIRILTIDEMGEFFAHREHGVDLKIPTADEWRKGANVCYDAHPDKPDTPLRPVKFILDEVHVKFDSRGWQSQGPHVTFYNSQHRKLDDEIVFISQFPELVDKRLKAFGQEHLYSENHAMERLFTLFRAPAYFTVSSYLKERTGHNDVAQWRTRFTLDLEIARLYDTSAGVGIKGRKKPETRKRKGISVLWAVAGIVLASMGLLWLSDWLPKKLAGKTEGTPPPQRQQPIQPPPQAEVQVRAFEFAPPPAVLPPIQEEKTPFKKLYVTGVVTSGQRFTVQLSDGRTLREGMDMVESWDGSRIVLKGGETLWVLPRDRPPLIQEKPKELDSVPTEETTGERQPLI